MWKCFVLVMQTVALTEDAPTLGEIHTISSPDDHAKRYGH